MSSFWEKEEEEEGGGGVYLSLNSSQFQDANELQLIDLISFPCILVFMPICETLMLISGFDSMHVNYL